MNAFPTNHPLVWRGQFGNMCSFAKVAREMVLAFSHLGCKVQAEETKERLPFEEFLPTAKASALRELHNCSRPEKYILIQHDVAGRIEPDPKASANIACTAHEADRLPSNMARSLITFDQVWVPSEFNRRIYIKAGLRAEQVKVVPHGICPIQFSPELTPLRILNRPAFLFISLSIANARKAIEILVGAFLSEFRATEDVGLLVRAGASQVIAPIRAWKAKQAGACAKVFLYQFMLHEDCVRPFYTAGDAYVVASRGEGFGLTYIEALASGVPVIATGWGGQLDFLNDSNSYLLPVKRFTTASSGSAAEASPPLWAEIDFYELGHLMRHLYNNVGEAQSKALAGKAEAFKSWTWDLAAQKALQHLSEI